MYGRVVNRLEDSSCDVGVEVDQQFKEHFTHFTHFHLQGFITLAA